MLLEKIVETIIEEKSAPQAHRNLIIARIVEALERDPSWVDTYITTGELQVPTLTGAGELDELLAASLEASCHNFMAYSHSLISD
jgi:hypothetical protein